MNIPILLYLLLIHWIADFVLQSGYVSENKGRHFMYLCIHILQYGSILAAMSLILLLTNPTIGLINLMLWVSYNTLLHLIIDFVTSKLTTHYRKYQKTHAFFVILGFDQFLHQVSILIIANYLLII